MCIRDRYQKVPRDHRYRLQTLILAILAAAGRRFAEVAALPLNCLRNEPTGETALRYFPRKVSYGQTFTPLREVWLATHMAPIVKGAVEELSLIHI